MTRTREQIISAMADAARLSAFRDDATWRDALFEDSSDGWRLSLQGEPDRALLAALADEYVGLDAHRATLVRRLHVSWLHTILGIERLPVVPDRVVASATVEPKLAPAVIPAGTMLRGGKDAFGNERRYRTLDALTAHGATLTGVRVLVPGGPTPAKPGLAFAAPEFPVNIPDTVPGIAAGPPAPHIMRIYSAALAFPSGDLKARFRFIGAAPADIYALRDGTRWRWPLPDGTMSAFVNAQASPLAETFDVTLGGGCADPDGGTPWIECVMKADYPVPIDLQFTAAQVQVINRAGLVPDAAFVNSGAVDITKEFEPFAINASKGDSFYVRCDEALSKVLENIVITVADVAPASGGGIVGGSGTIGTWGVGVYYALAAKEEKESNKWAGVGWGPAHPGATDMTIGTGGTIYWQQLAGGVWTSFGPPMTKLSSRTTALNAEGSQASQVSGQPGRYLRAYITSGDLGWAAYQRALAQFASDAVSDPSSAAGMPLPLVAAIHNGLTIGYTTVSQDATKVESWSGWRHIVKDVGTWKPFRKTVDGGASTGMVAFGLNLPSTVTGSSVSLYVELDSPSPCTGNDEGSSQWQWWDGTAWHALLVADGTQRMRESGLVRFVAPAGWADGCTDVSADAGRWFRYITTRPDRIGVIHSAIPDAVLAQFVSTASDPTTDPSPASAIPVGTIKGTLAPIPGVKKVTNLASVRGRGPENDDDYTRRAAALVRHRGRALTAWDYEQMVAIQFPEVAAVRCLPHTDSSGGSYPGSVGLVVIPDRPDAREPRPSVSLAGRIQGALEPVMPVGALISIMCPLYVPVRVEVSVRLRRGVAAMTGKANITAGLEALLHPTGTTPTRWGVSLYASSMIAALERLPEVDSVQSFVLHGPAGAAEVVPVDACRGLYSSTGDHALNVEESL